MPTHRWCSVPLLARQGLAVEIGFGTHWVEARRPQLTVRPAFPRAWQHATLEGLRVGPGRASLRLDDRRIDVSWAGPNDLEVVGRTERVTVAPGANVSLSRDSAGPGSEA